LLNHLSSYSSPFWLQGGHLQTIVPALISKKPCVELRRERWDTPDQDFIDVDFIDGEIGKPLLVMFHGLEGSSDSHYAKAMMAHVQSLGWSGAVPHFRACSGEINLAPRFYHSGDSAEIAWILRRLHTQHNEKNPHSKFYATGVSLGANALLRFLGEFQHQASFVDAACAVSAPLDLTKSNASLEKGFNIVYIKKFLHSLKPKCIEKLKQYPNLFSKEDLLAAKNLYEFDNVVTAPLHGYKNAKDYWQRASSGLILNDIVVPSLVFNAKNDPFLPEAALPQTCSSKHVTLDYPKHGGHVGFPTGWPLGKIDWLPHYLTSYLQSHG
jgi:predicted alpha/beta-fold hydrolase